MDRRCLIQASSIDLVSTQIITNDQKDLRKAKMIDRDINLSKEGVVDTDHPRTKVSTAL